MTSLIMDEERLRAERNNRGSWKSRVTGLDDVPGGYQPPPPGGRRPQRPSNANRANSDDDLEYKLALEASKNEAEADAVRRSRTAGGGEDDADLAKALKLSEEEAELRKRELEDQNNANLLFDDTPTTEQAPQATGWNQGYTQQPQVDWYGNPVGMQQSQQTGYLANAYSQPTGQFQNGFGGGFGYNQPQQTGFEQMQQPSQQFLQPQNTFNPWAQSMQPQQTQQNGFAQQPQQPEQPAVQPGSNNPWATSTASTGVAPQPTGSNNPFASIRPPQQSHSSFKAPTLNTLAEQRAQDQFNQRPNPITNYSSPMPSSSPAQALPVQPPPQQQRLSPLSAQPEDPYKANLSALLGSREGQDTFGNVGDLRIPAQHTAPGTFVNSAGAGSMGRLEASKTGTNPFFTQNTAAQFQYPAQTGPATNFGSSNPFGPRPGQQQQGQQGGSLIDL
jgi:epsin